MLLIMPRQRTALMYWTRFAFLAVCLGGGLALHAQAPGQFDPPQRFELANSSLKIEQPVNFSEPFTVAGELGGIFGRQDGRFELWSFPVKVLEHFEIIAELADYSVPIAMNEQARTIEVSPDHTTITYSHAAIVVKQHMFAIRNEPDAPAGAVVLFEIASTRRATLTFRFKPALTPEWPAPDFGNPSASWLKIGNGGGYLLTTASPQMFGVVAMPGATPGILPPYQEQPRLYPLEFKLSFDPQRDRKVFFPLLAITSYNGPSSSPEAVNGLAQQVFALNSHLANLYGKTEQHYAHFFDDKMTIETPDAAFDRAFRWAELAIDQSQATYHGETGLVAGWYGSGDSSRPGFGWFFGRDTLWTLFAVDSYGDFGLARRALEFLTERQRSDGKIMHEFSQTADQVNWKSMPYFYASADSTPLFVIVVADYVQASGDLSFLRDNWDHVKRAYLFTRAHDSDGDGVYDNSQGTGWVESWPPGMPHQELYLAALDEQSTEAIARLAVLMGDHELSERARAQAELIRGRLAAYRQQGGFYAFSKNADGSYDSTATIFPSVAWWTGRLSLPNADAMLQRWASSEFSTDWGARSVSNVSSLYDPLSYHQGTVWPLFTGWVSMAEYRAGHPLAGYQELRSNVDLTWAQDPGAVTELLSGEFYEPLGRSTSHQMWSSGMVLSPAIRGMLGIEADVVHGYLKVAPKLPAGWEQVTVHHAPFGNDFLEVSMRRVQHRMLIDADSQNKTVVCIATNGAEFEHDCEQAATTHHSASMALPAVEVDLESHAVNPGAATQQMKILEENYAAGKLSLKLEAPGGSAQEMWLRYNGKRKLNVQVTGASQSKDRLHIVFPNGDGYQQRVVEIRW